MTATSRPQGPAPDVEPPPIARPRLSGLTAALLPGRGVATVLERQVISYSKQPLVLASGAFEPLFYLLALGIGLDRLIGEVAGPGGRLVDYASFVAPGMLVVSAMTGSLFDSTYNFFYKLRQGNVFSSMIATPLTPTEVLRGELSWAMVRGLLYSISYVAVAAALGLVGSWWVPLAIPVAALVGFAFACCGAAATTWVRGWADFGYVFLVIDPLMLFSTTIFPIETYPDSLAWIVRATPLYHGVELSRAAWFGHFDPTLFVHVGYLVVMAAIGWTIAARRVERLLTP